MYSLYPDKLYPWNNLHCEGSSKFMRQMYCGHQPRVNADFGLHMQHFSIFCERKSLFLKHKLKTVWVYMYNLVIFYKLHSDLAAGSRRHCGSLLACTLPLEAIQQKQPSSCLLAPGFALGLRLDIYIVSQYEFW